MHFKSQALLDTMHSVQLLLEPEETLHVFIFEFCCFGTRQVGHRRLLCGSVSINSLI